MKKRFHFWVGVSLVLVYGVIAAGAVVRMTGSGMGCPDWPKCFGYLIPPTERAQLDWTPNHFYQKGQVIIVDESLRIALKDFVSTKTYHPAHWGMYTKHDYALFNPLHTWIEFLNRLLGALGGLATLMVAFLSFWQWNKSKRIPIIAWLIVFGMGFQAWLGKTVVDSNLQPFKITVHMIMALVIVAFLLYLYFISKAHRSSGSSDSVLKTVTIVTLVLTLFQIGMGTQVRQFVDHQIDLFGEYAKETWLSPTPFIFYFHRSFSLLVALANLYLFVRIRRKMFPTKMINIIMGLIGAEIFTGILMYYFDFPFATQPLHLLFASFLFGAQSYLLLQLYQPSYTTSL